MKDVSFSEILTVLSVGNFKVLVSLWDIDVFRRRHMNMSIVLRSWQLECIWYLWGVNTSKMWIPLRCQYILGCWMHDFAQNKTTQDKFSQHHFLHTLIYLILSCVWLCSVFFAKSCCNVFLQSPHLLCAIIFSLLQN